MPRYVAFLRAINVGGHVVTMDRLRTLFEEMGFADVATFIASGNVIFTTDETDTAALETRIAAHLQNALGYPVATFLRTDAQVKAIAECECFPQAERETAQGLNVTLLASPLPPDAAESLNRFTTDVDRFHAHGTELYWLCKVKISESTVFQTPFWKDFGKQYPLEGTMRTINTFVRLAKKYPPAG